MALAIIILSPNSWVISLMYGVSPQPAQAPENSNRGLRNWLFLTVYLFMSSSRSGSLAAKSQFAPSVSCTVCRGTILSALVLAGQTSTQLPQPVQSSGET